MKRITVTPHEPIRVEPSEKKTPPENGRAKRFQRSKAAPRIHLTDRDLEVLEALAVHRILSGQQLRRLVLGCSPSRARRRLRALYDHGLIERVSVVAQPTRGIPPFVYVLTKRGAAALRELGFAADGRGINGAGLKFVRHQLLINEFYIALHEATREADCGIRTWRHEQDLKLPTADGRGVVEQVSHPSFPGRIPFLPDGFFELEVGPGKSFAYFLEIDLATHAQRVWRKRALLYSAYADQQAGLFRRRFGRETFRLLIVTTPDYRKRSRRDNILETINKTVGPSDLFLAATLSEITPGQILGNVWRSPGGKNTCSILDNPAAAKHVRVRPQQPKR